MRILLVDDEKESRSFLADYLLLLGHHVDECSSGEEALETYKRNRYEMVLSDIKMGGMSGIDLIRDIKALKCSPEADLVLYTGFIDIALTIGALRVGAYDYLTKPINVQELKAVLNRVEEHQFLLNENKELVQHFDEKVKSATKDTERQLEQLKKIIAEQAGIGHVGVFSNKMKNIVQQAEKYHTDRSLPVLIQGETGVGKEIIARMVHYGKLENPGPFIDINCTAITPSLFESELFGYEAGSFTGGTSRGSKGKLDMAMGGTLFLDEIAEIPIELQPKLLRVLEEKSFYRVGGLRKIKTDLRIICATNVDFEKRIEQGLFRTDLYYRLKVGQIIIPPLRERQEDILPLSLMFLQDFAQRRGKHFAGISNSAAEFLLHYPWPGNVRELRNVMEWVSFMYDEEELKIEHLSNINNRYNKTSNGATKAESAFDGSQKKLEAQSDNFALQDRVDSMVEEALEKCGGNKTKAANYLGIAVRTLYYRLEKMKKKRSET
ncbi:sigma-54 dependent transcriptional regulator [Sporomusa sp. KB1]|jgi:DNA-binding NtrC family response regulator|uniref:sigma-54-dependent transcriptional regulator n=1 Tax=Sporomusa sp. KB1 TaxID=943346 RepID=UPI0011A63C2E|nr:sigma-54 dependent transcriptional regulator [Sporomusa sp. KB1]TWH46509.1 DNA-binding NtrC family response regulator [Sporomusa sp. KB1]